MAVPQVVIIGRPNVGKSSLLNWLSGLRLAIVEDRLRDGRPLLMGDQPSIADCSLAAALQFGRMGKVDLDPAYQNIKRWDVAFRERLSAQQVLSM